ncbi:MAG: homoserine dehydrogenase [Clostridia bacterium]|nr:homoserine dehydrogenase [Clostridia bacterium]
MKSIGILGFGVVGSGVAEVIAMNTEKIAKHMGEEVRVKRILDLRDFPDSPFNNLVTHDSEEFFNDSEISIVVETIGGARVAYEFTKRALSMGKSVVTSNKELVSTHGVELMQLAEDNNCSYLFEAAVGGGIPIIRPLHRCLAANQILKIAGIVNGTTNFILTKMRDEGLSYDDALKQAQANGYAEQNPTADVEGIDAQRKLSILSSIALSGQYVSPDSIHTEGISKLTLDDINFAESINASVKLIAYFSHPEGGVPAVFVAPHVVSKSSLIASVDGVFNAIMVEGNALGESMFYGQGAGKLATASAVVADVLDAGLHLHKDVHITKWYNTDSKVTLDYEDVVVSILVKGDADAVSSTLVSYETSKLADNAVVVKGIAHKDIDAKLPSGATWLHYLG